MYRFIVVMLFAGLAFAQSSPNPDSGSTNPAVPAADTSSDSSNSATPAPPSGSSNSATQATPASSSAQADNAQREREGKDALFDLPPVPKDPRVSLIGGKVVKVDQIMNRIAIQPFGGNKTEAAFDVRTQVYRDGASIAIKDLRPGDRVYADTLLDNGRVFAKSIRVVTKAQEAERAHGQVVSYDAASGKFVMRDELLPEPVTLRLSKDTVICKGEETGSTADLIAGALVSVTFIPGGRGVVQELSVLAVPGTSFTFSGPVTRLNLATHLLVVANKTDGKSYEIDYDPARLGTKNDLREGSEVSVSATFDGQRYSAQTVSVIPEASQANQ
jgi:hypothetical protein